MIKTDLKKILSISGEPGLFRFVAQANAGVVAESLSTGKRNLYGMSARLTTLSEISIYTSDEEVSLIVVFEKMKEVLGDDMAPQPKSAPEVLKSFFEKTLPNYDKERFYVSHMKKVVDWYNQLKSYATLDFEKSEEIEGESASE
jgi:nitrate reductase NapAB chaperone NapD